MPELGTGKGSSEELHAEVNGEEVAARIHRADSSRWLIMLHGFGADKGGSMAERAARAAEEGWNAVRLDFRGNGESGGDFIDQNLSSRVEDVKTVIEAAGIRSYTVFGVSFGGKVAFQLAAEDSDCEAVIGKSPVTFNRTMEPLRNATEKKGEFEFIDGKPIDRRFFEDLDSYSFEETAGKIDVPVLIFHGGSDSTVKLEDSLDAAKLLNVDLTLEKLEGVRHSFSDDAERKMRDSMFDWLERT
ncbi:MAG: alpha/beta hydrolase family protein [Candidatus Nanohaloarchaea archaeon]